MGTVTALKQKPAASFGDMLAATATKAAPKAKKASMTTLEAPPEVKAAVDDYQESKINWKQAEASMTAAGEVIQAFVRERQDADGYAGKYQGSYAVMGTRHQAKVIYANKFSLNPDDEGELVAILGESFDSLINRQFSVRLKSEVLENEALQGELMALIGDRFTEFFETVCTLGVTEGFSREIYRAVAPENLDLLRTYARQYKPSIR